VPALFDRQWSLQVDTLDLSDLDLAFKVERSVWRTPNLAEIRVWNLSETTRAEIQRRETVVLRAGYEDPPTLFRGDIRRVWTETDGIDLVTVLQARDGGRAYSEARIARSYNPGTPVVTVLRDVIADMEIGQGNLAEYAAAYALRNGADTFGDGYVAAGPARRVLDALTRAAGLRWSVQNGALQLLRQGTPLQSRAVLLTSDTGLLDSPTWDERGIRTEGRRGLLTARALIQPGIEPGRKVRVESRLVEGDFEVRKIQYQGETRGDAWDAVLELRPIS
jgi:hypothetical protein